METKDITYVIFGASGDLSRRYLMPALKNMNFEGDIIPMSRKDYGNFKNLVTSKDNGGEKIFHLAIPPEGVLAVIEMIYRDFGNEKVKIVLEKPFGVDYKSAQNLVRSIDKYFSEDQIYRVDHYLAKKSLAKISTEKWNKNNIESIDIIASEKIDIESRVNFYEQTGALKDFVQSHLLEMAALTLAGTFHTDDRHQALEKLAVVCNITERECVKRGQYAGYREEVGNQDSITETFVELNLASSDELWRGVNIRLATGKALEAKITQIKITYMNGDEKIFDIEHEKDAYESVLRGVISGSHDLFISNMEILETWRIIQAVQEAWSKDGADLIIYPKGSAISNI